MPSEHDRAHAAKAAEQRQQRRDVRTGESAAHLCRFFIRHRLDEELQHARASQPCELQHAAAYYYWESHVNVPNATNTGWQGPEGDARGADVFAAKALATLAAARADVVLVAWPQRNNVRRLRLR